MVINWFGFLLRFGYACSWGIVDTVIRTYHHIYSWSSFRFRNTSVQRHRKFGPIFGVGHFWVSNTVFLVTCVHFVERKPILFNPLF